MAPWRKTYSWVDFRPDLSRAPIALWIRLGEAAAICDGLGHLPLKPAVAREIHKIYLAKGVLATTAIEGNTLSLDEVGRSWTTT
ncbi:hypothetical protein L6R50_01765 [Myxococcota bacterium]|nr:hypothetical protein [Myxococcota bacterium]